MASSVASYTELRAKVDSLFATSSGAIGATDEAPLVDRALQEAGAALARAQDGGSKGDLALATSVRPIRPARLCAKNKLVGDAAPT